MADGCVDFGQATVCFGPPMEEYSRKALGERWCFRCRRRRPFDRVVLVPTRPSYYGPEVSVRCENGHDDGDLFPGRYREWEEAYV